jgi:hypothetical protein
MLQAALLFRVDTLLPYKKEEVDSKSTVYDDKNITKETDFSNKLILLVEDDQDVRAIIRE